MQPCNLVTILFLLVSCVAAHAGDSAALVRDRTAIERVYYNHRLGQKPPFEQATPPVLIERLVKEDLRKEGALRKVYGVAITPALLDAEMQRINTTTRAPEMLAEIKAALGNDPAKFAQVFAKPFLVERLLREKFDNDDALHAPQRQEAERVRESLIGSSRGYEPLTNDSALRTPHSAINQSLVTSAATNGSVATLLALLEAGHSNAVSETTWQLTPRPAETNAPAADELEIKRRFGPDAQIISSPRGGERDRKFYFEDLPPPLQNVLRAQLRQPGDVSAVIETPGGFLLYLCTARTAGTLSAAVLSLPKRSYEEWLAGQAP